MPLRKDPLRSTQKIAPAGACFTTGEASAGAHAEPCACFP